MNILRMSLLLFLLISMTGNSTEWQNNSGGQLTIIQSSNSLFPHPLRATGHTYKDSLYSYEKHYSDSSVAIFIPQNYQLKDSVHLVFYFHGWWNNIHKSMNEFKLPEQFSNSKKNAIFVFPEGPKDAPDSFGGKLEEKNIFKQLVHEVLHFLYSEKKITSAQPGKIILSGHSGAYRVISLILNRGGLTDFISEVYLFDALYGQLQKYSHWLEKYQGRFINIVTPNGGTKYNSEEFLNDLDDWQMSYYRHERNEISLNQLLNERIIFIFTDLSHNEVIDPYFKLFLQSSWLKSIK